MEKNIIPPEKFKDAFKRLGWIYSTSQSGKYDIWSFNQNRNIWATIPKDQNSIEYQFYQEKNIRLLIYTLELEDNEHSFTNIFNQLKGYSYQLINRIVNKESFSQEAVPYELATAIPSKNIDAFRSFYLMKKDGKESIPIEKFQLNHTQHGSFVIPISVQAEVNEESLVPMASSTNIYIREYLDTVDRLVSIARTDKESYGKKVIDEGIDSKIVKDFFYRNDSIAKIKEKYSEIVEEISITSQSNPILDHRLSQSYKDFKNVELGRISILPDDYIAYIEKLEEEADSASREDINARVEAAVDSIDTNGTAKFTVFTINGEEIKHPFKARTVQLPTIFLNLCASAFISREKIVIQGDLRKPKGKIGKIVTSSMSQNNENPNLFSQFIDD